MESEKLKNVRPPTTPSAEVAATPPQAGREFFVLILV